MYSISEIFNKRIYDFGGYINPTTFIDALEYELSVNLNLGIEGTFEERLGNRFKTIVENAIIDAIEYLLPRKSVYQLLSNYKKFTYESKYRSEVDNIFARVIESIALKIGNDVNVNQNDLYVAYLAIEIISSLLKTGLSDGSEYIGLTPFEIVDTYGMVRASGEFVSESTFRQIKEHDPLIYQVVKYPVFTAQLVRKKYFRTYVGIIDQIHKQAVLNSFFIEIVNKKYPQLNNVESLISQQISKLSMVEYEDLISRINKLHAMGIIQVNTSVSIPSQADIDEVESFVLPESIDEQVDYKEYDLSGSIIDYRKDIIIYVGAQPFPSIASYILFKLFDNDYMVVRELTYNDINYFFNKYVLLHNSIYHSIDKILFLNEIKGVGDKILHDFECKEYKPTDDFYRIVYEIMCLYNTLSNKYRDITSGVIVPSILMWISTISESLESLGVTLNIKTLNQKQINNLTSLVLGSCDNDINTKNINLFSKFIDIVLAWAYENMLGIITQSDVISVKDILEYGYTHSRSSNLNLSQRDRVNLATDNIFRLLRSSFDIPEFTLVKASVLFLVGGKIDIHPVYDEFSEQISREYRFSDKSSSYINGFYYLVQSKQSRIMNRRLFMRTL